ncbi:interactor of constitutive active ROPs 3 [Prosopis cineraria]|uniref:interactor of constitutive active ROPs 3 n=1 Tax=Prosopis cineraria TaxID=364024 RepID=UPI0024106B0F|nr:interactor of constitutive active ROPs 3 [Prosopis cineraria]XP_054811074.1 interactor of constitutive active ROPs 3 [Prosopis cineraria]XP_054811075.1 interactor of constitutive active ROPs 3 [Prosopis cineraria]XP_054811076.1 interactor of constitutive active ROPs 3 [Prosopis cineraria]XP_054811077.1 interactor of constitutive active ROPs 3 [Prosopis cineraria]XP_054811078.1 interactor of constitutive active ROPs 3 [Prosopis cineraria]XP_054811079.1 interactor of constitutive active ROPs
MQTPKTRSGSSEVPQKVSPRAVRQLRPSPLESNSASSFSQANRASKERSPKVAERRSPRSPVPERKRPSRISELESQVAQLQDDLEKARNQLCSSESCKRQAQQEAEESKEKLVYLSEKLTDSQKQLEELSASKDAHVIEPQEKPEEHDEAWQDEVKAAMTEIQQLKAQLELITACENAQNQHTEPANSELLNLKESLAKTLSFIENMKNQLRECKESEAQAQALVNETLHQLEAAKRTVELLRADSARVLEGYNSIALELDQSRARANSLEALVSKLENLKVDDPNQIEGDIYSLKSEIRELRSALEITETKYQEEQIRNTVEVGNAYELMEQIRSESTHNQTELEDELNKRKAEIEELKANLMDKETELQGIVEENENLNLKLEKSLSAHRENELKKDVKRLEECVAELKADLMDKETTLQSISEENETLKIEIKKRFSDGGRVKEDVEAAKEAEREALLKLGIAMEEADSSKRKAERVGEQLEAAQVANSEMEAELRRLKVQSDQWRKAAEAAAAMLSAGGGNKNNGKLAERSVSMDGNYDNNPLMGKCSSFVEDIDEDFQQKKNGNMLKKIGVLWKKPQK